MTEATSTRIRVGTRGSALARVQTDHVVEQLRRLGGGFDFETVVITTSGDKIKDRPIAELGSLGVFVKELEDALLANEVDLVVHSLKDLPTEMPPLLALGAVLDREDPRDVLVATGGRQLRDLPAGARVATSSRRRAAQLKAVRADLQFVDIRGNVPTRLRKLEEGGCDAIVLAAAGLKRLGLDYRISEYLEPELCTPAVGQGALAVEVRGEDTRLTALMRSLDNACVKAEVVAERALLLSLGGGCSVPIGGLARTTAAGHLDLTGCVASLDGKLVLRERLTGTKDEAEALGTALAQQLISLGANDILNKLKAQAPNKVSPP